MCKIVFLLYFSANIRQKVLFIHLRMRSDSISAEGPTTTGLRHDAVELTLVISSVETPGSDVTEMLPSLPLKLHKQFDIYFLNRTCAQM